MGDSRRSLISSVTNSTEERADLLFWNRTFGDCFTKGKCITLPKILSVQFDAPILFQKSVLSESVFNCWVSFKTRFRCGRGLIVFNVRYIKKIFFTRKTKLILKIFYYVSRSKGLARVLVGEVLRTLWTLK